MRQALRIAMLQFRLMLKSKGAIAVMFIMPLLLTLIFGALEGTGGGGGTPVYPVAVADSDGSFASIRLVEALEQEASLKVQVIDPAQMDRTLADKTVMAGVVIPAGYGAGLEGGVAPEVRVTALAGSGDSAYVLPAVRKVVSRTAGDYRLARGIAGPDADAALLQAAYRQILDQRQSGGARLEQVAMQRTGPAPQSAAVFSVNYSAVGFTVMFVMMLLFIMTSAILSEREAGTWGRLLTAPVSRLTVLSGFLISFFITGLFQFLILVAATRLLFRTNWGPLLPLLAMASVFILCSAAMGLFLAGLVKTADQQKTIGNLVVIATSMLGGTYWPLELMNPTLQRIGYMTPQAWAMEGFREVMLRGGAWSGIRLPVEVLAALTVIFLAAGLVRIRYE